MQSVLTQISVVVIGYAGFVVLAALFSILRWRARPPWLVSLVWMLEFLMAVRALAGVAAIAGGERPDAFATHVGYLAASVCVMPIAVGSIDADDEGVWTAGVIAVAAIAVSVIAVRLQQTV
ncbi:MAG: hypothetical protein LH468_09290 [Nocardioides sp.]|nr:hypothetical protein [Nocardioides sp.]